MSIFDQIGEKISSAGQETATKAKKFAETTKLNNRIGDYEKQISQLYFEIGKAYYEKHMQDESAEEKERIEKIRDLDEEIAHCREQIRDLKGVMCCASCGAEIVSGAAFCNVCGEKVIQPNISTEQDPRCPGCNARIQPGAIFCVECGTRLTEEGE